MSVSLPAGRAARVRVSATTANLGPGFDSLGLALNWADTAEAEVLSDGIRVEITGNGADTLPHDETHLVVATIVEALTALGVNAPGLRFCAHNTIPLAHGLGSSSAAIVAGLGLAWGLARPNEPMDREWALTRAVDIEGHPDNVGPAIYGGLTIGWTKDGHTRLASPTISPDVRVTALVPPHSLATESARAAMPTTIPFADAVANSSRTALLVHAFTGDPDLLGEATADYLHQEYRRSLYPDSLALVDSLRAAGLGAAISGAGPTVVVFSSVNQRDLLEAALEQAWSASPLFSQFKRYDLRPGRGVEIL